MLTIYKAVVGDVYGLMTASDARDYGLVCRGRGNPFVAGVRIFTFVPEAAMVKEPKLRKIHCGSHEFIATLLDTIVGKDQYQIVENDAMKSGWDGKIPLADADLKFSKDATPEWFWDMVSPEDIFKKFTEHLNA
jgi:hypothetical protein